MEEKTELRKKAETELLKSSLPELENCSTEMKKFFKRIEKQYSLQKEDYTSSMIFMSHETYTPARGGSSDTEVFALKHSFPEHYKNLRYGTSPGIATWFVIGIKSY